MSDSLRPHGPQHARPPCPSPTSRVYSNSCPLSWWCYATISSSVVPFSSCLQSFPASGFFPMNQSFTSGSQRVGVSTSASVLTMNIQDWFPFGVSASASVLPVNIQDWFPLRWTGWISLQSKGKERLNNLTGVTRETWKPSLYCPHCQNFLLSSSQPHFSPFVHSLSLFIHCTKSTRFVCLIETVHPASDTRYMWLFGHKCHCSGVTRGHPLLHFLITDTEFLASCRFQLSLGKVVPCALWRVLHAAVSKGWVPRTCPWELGADTAADPFQSQTYYSTRSPDNLIQEVNSPNSPWHEINFSRVNRNRTRREDENTSTRDCRPAWRHIWLCHCFSGVEPSNQRREIPVLVAVWASHPLMDPNLLPTVSHWNGHSPCSLQNLQGLSHHRTEVQSLITVTQTITLQVDRELELLLSRFFWLSNSPF